MGVSILHPYNIPEGKTAAQTIEYLTKRLLTLGALQSGHFIVDCETYLTAAIHGGNSKAIHILHNSEHPASTFAILESGTKQITLVADSLFDLLMLKMTSNYISKKQTKIESKGLRFEYGDFLIKLGIVAMSENFKGILIECEYLPCVIPSNCWDLIRELLQGFLGSSIPNTIPSYFTTPNPVLGSLGHPSPNHTKQNDVYQPIDTICQYLENFTTYRKQTTLSSSFGSRA